MMAAHYELGCASILFEPLWSTHKNVEGFFAFAPFWSNHHLEEKGEVLAGLRNVGGEVRYVRTV
jgi:hypothetical protein